jgi:hypothetical protein
MRTIIVAQDGSTSRVEGVLSLIRWNGSEFEIAKVPARDVMLGDVVTLSRHDIHDAVAPPWIVIQVCGISREEIKDTSTPKESQ